MHESSTFHLEITFTQCSESYESGSNEETADDDDDDDDNIFLPTGQKDKSVKLWTQDKLNDLVRELRTFQ